MTLRGSSGMVKMRFGTLNLASRPESCAIMSGSGGGLPVTTATTLSPKSPWGTPMTADSVTPFDGVELVLDLLGIDVQPTRNDEILAAPDDRDAPVFFHHAEVAGDEIAVGAERLAGFLGMSQ
jgi:hypothetical protein